MDISNPVLIIALALTTLAIVLAYAIYQRYRAHAAKKTREHSALMDDPRMVHTEERTRS